MASYNDAALQVAETVQTAHINQAPTSHDVAPSTAADTAERVGYEGSSRAAIEPEEGDEHEVPLSVLRPLPHDHRSRRPPQLQLPDMRFEQSYLKSIGDAKDWKGVAYVTIKDQVLMPFVQGMAWNLIVAWWRHWNTATKFYGETAGARIRRWWWGVNEWPIPSSKRNPLRSDTGAGK